MFSKTNSEFQICNRALAIEFSQMPALLGERPLKQSRLTFLRDHIKAKTFISPTWAVAIDKNTGERFRANGQHSSTVLAEVSEEDFPQGLMVTIDEYSSDNLNEDAFEIFDAFDNPKSVRGNVDAMNVYRVHYPELAEIESQILLNLMTGVSLFEKNLPNGIFYSSRDRGLYLENVEYRNFAVWAAPFANTLHGWMLKKAGIVAEMVGDRRVDQEVAGEFWQLAFNESHPDADHETRELSRTLKEWASKPTKISQDRFRKEAAKQWRRFRKVHSTPPLELNYDDRSTTGPSEATL
jgi:hypothetical protein